MNQQQQKNPRDKEEQEIIGNKYESTEYIAQIIIPQIKIYMEQTGLQPDLLYESQALSLAIFQNLSAVSKQFIFRTIKSVNFQVGAYKKWMEDEADPIGSVDNLNHELNQLGIIRIDQITGRKGIVKNTVINSNFKNNLLRVFSSQIMIKYRLVSKITQEKEIAENDTKCINNWKKIYNNLDGNNSYSSMQKNPNLVSVMNKYKDKNNKFTFILSSTKHQLNSFLCNYTKHLINKKPDMAFEIIKVITDLSILHPSNIYEFSNPSDLQREIIKDFKVIGLLIHKESGNNETKYRFCVSKMLHNFLVAEPQIRVDINCEIIVETNFNVYVEIKDIKDGNQIQDIRRLLEDFCQIKVIFPHMIVAHLTPDKVVSAYQTKGITADLIKDFFNKCCSSKRRAYVNERRKQQKQFNIQKTDGVQKKPLSFLKLYAKDYEMSLIPENVVQQLELWEKEKGDMDVNQLKQQCQRMNVDEDLDQIDEKLKKEQEENKDNDEEDEY